MEIYCLQEQFKNEERLLQLVHLSSRSQVICRFSNLNYNITKWIQGRTFKIFVCVGRGVLFDLGPTFMFVSDKCTDVYPSFLQVPKPTQLKIHM